MGNARIWKRQNAAPEALIDISLKVSKNFEKLINYAFPECQHLQLPKILSIVIWTIIDTSARN